MRARHARAALPLVVVLTLTAAAQPPSPHPAGCDLSTRGVISGITPAGPPSFAEKLAALREGTRYVVSKLGIPAELRLFNSYTTDPNARIQQLLNQSEDLRQIGLEWQRIWFSDYLAGRFACCWPY